MVAATVICLPFFGGADGDVEPDRARSAQSGEAQQRHDPRATSMRWPASASWTVRCPPPSAWQQWLRCFAARPRLDYREARLGVLLMLGQGLFLLATPAWFAHSAGFTGVRLPSREARRSAA